MIPVLRRPRPPGTTVKVRFRFPPFRDLSRVLVAKEFSVIRSLLSFRTLSVVAAVALTMFVGSFASAQEATGGRALIDLTSAFGVGLVVIGAAYGISKLASVAYESMARQPEVSGNIQTAMIIAAALIEGFTFYALFICSSKN